MPRQSTRTPRQPKEPCDTLVVLWPEPKDRTIAMEQGWYRIRPGQPVNDLGDLRAVKHLLFYQPKTFGATQRRIEYSARIRDYEKVTRIALLPEELDHPRANALYHCFRLEPLERLAEPITSRISRRVLFARTTQSRIAGVSDINDLFTVSHIEDRLYGGLRESGLLPERQLWLDVKTPGARGTRTRRRCLDMALFCRDTRIDVECDGDTWHTGPARAAQDRQRDNALTANGWHILRFGTSDINHALPDAVAAAGFAYFRPKPQAAAQATATGGS